MTETKGLTPSLTAHIDERLLAPLRRNPQATRWFVVTALSILFIHAVLLGLFLYRDRTVQDLAARQEPTPVEIVVEKPKEPPKPPQAKPAPAKPPSPPVVEKPASSAPRAPDATKVDTAAAQKETHAPKAAAPPTDGRPDPSKESVSPSSEQAKADKSEEAAAKPDVLQKDAEALDKATPQPPKPKPKKLAKTTPRAKTRRATTALQQLAGASALPDYSFSRPTKPSPVYGGSEDSRYLAIVYGMIMRNRDLVSVPGAGGGNVTLAFNVDDDGNVTEIGVQRTSGYPEVDAAAANAIRRAAPFPSPPPGAPHGLIATIDFGSGAPTYATGGRAVR